MLVKETISFQRGLDPKKVLGIGEHNLSFDKWKDLVFNALNKYFDEFDFVEAIMDYAKYNNIDKEIYNKNYSIAKSAQEILYYYEECGRKRSIKCFK